MQQHCDEWSLIVNRQAELNRLREQEEMLAQRQQKDSYKQDLQFQHHLKELERERERRGKDAETQEVAARAQYFQEDAKRRKEEDKQLKKSLADEYRLRQEEIERREEEDRARKRAEEQRQLELVRQQLEEESRRKKAQKEALSQQEQFLLEFKRKEEAARQQRLTEERAYEAELQQKYAEREERKEQDYRDFYQKVSQAQEAKVSQHQQVVTSLQQEKDSKLNMWILQNQADYQQHLAEKEAREREIRLAALQETNRTVQLQMQEKERQRQMEAEERQRLRAEVEERRRANKEAEEQMDAERRQQQMQYREVLNAQTTINQDARASSQRLSDFERKLNKGFLDSALPRSTLQNSASHMIRGYEQTQFQANAKAFFGADSVPQSRDDTWEKDAKAFFGADSQPQSRGGIAAASASYQRNERNFFGSDTPTGGTRAGATDFYQRNARLFYGADTPVGDSPVRPTLDAAPGTSDSFQQNVKRFYGADTPDASARPGRVDPTQMEAAGRRPQKGSQWLTAQEVVGTTESWRRNARNFYGAETPEAGATRNGVSPIRGFDVQIGKPAPSDAARNPPLGSSESFQRNTRNFHGVETPELRQSSRSPNRDPPTASYQRNARRFYGAETPEQIDAYAQDVTVNQTLDPMWTKDVQAFYGDSRPASNGFASNVRAFYGDSTPPSAAGDHSPSKRLQADSVAAGAPLQRDYVDRSQHNPITNPIGGELPHASQVRPLYRARKINF